MGIYSGYPNSIYNNNNGNENYIVKNYDPDKTYFAGAVVKHNDKTYLFKSNSKVTGNFDDSKWEEVDPTELNRFIAVNFTVDANDYAYCRFEYNPFLKILLGNISVKFLNQIQTSYDINNLRITFDMPFVGYGSASSFAINSSNKIQYPQDSQVCCQLLAPDTANIHSGVSFWTNGVAGVFGMFSSQVFSWIKTENKNSV